MSSKIIKRRDFLKFTAISCLLPRYANALSPGSISTNNDEVITFIDSDYVIINGWVLLKSDLNYK